MSDDERKHLEGLDEQTERERWEEFHTGTDRVELTEDELAEITEKHQVHENQRLLERTYCHECGEWWPCQTSKLAARVQALADERDEQRAIITQLRGNLHVCPKQQKAEAERDAARAELAAANARLETWWKELENANGVRDKYKAENAALQATLDRVTALMESARTGRVAGYAAVLSCDLRAALTPEGKHVNCNCDDCDEERSLDPTPKGKP